LDEVIDEARKEQGYVAVTPFQDSAQANAEWHDENFVVPNGLRGQGSAAENQLNEQQKDFKAEVAGLFEHRTELQGTDILGALRGAEDVLDDHPDAGARYVLILSNMANVDVEGGITLKRSRKEPPLTHKQLDAMLESLDRVASLDGVCVHVVGGGEIHEPTRGRVQEGIRYFWAGYFDRADAIVAGWGPGITWPLRCRPIRFP
jgi:hypothetical protein